MRDDELLYGPRADLYDLIYGRLDYAAFTGRVAEILAAEGIGAAARVLEAACGTGSYLQHLARRYDVTGFDLSEDMLAISRRKNPGVPHFRADMRELHVDEPYQAVLCLCSSIGYLDGEEQLRQGIANFARALAPEGVLIIEPWLEPDKMTPGFAGLDTYQDDAIKVARASFAERREDRALIHFRWVLTRTGVGLEAFGETHQLWLCPAAVMERALRDAGFEVRHESDGLIAGRGLWIARKRPDDSGALG